MTITKKQTLFFPIFLALYELMAYLSNDAYLPALPRISQDLHTTHSLVQLSLTSWFLGFAALQLFMGPLSDRVGRRKVLLAGAVVFILSTFACALSFNITTLLIARFIQGASITSLLVAGYATIHDIFDHHRAIQTLAVMMAITILAPAFGPMIGGSIIYFSSWHWIFVALSLSTVILLIGLSFVMPHTQVDAEILKQKSIWAQYFSLLKNPQFCFYSFTTGSVFGVFVVWITAGPFLLMETYHLSMKGFALTQVVIFGALFVASISMKGLLRLLSTTWLIWIGISLITLGGIYAFITTLLWPTQFDHLFFGLTAIGFGGGLAFPILNRLTIETSDEPMGSRVAMSALMIDIFAVLGSVLVSVFYNGTQLSIAILLLVMCLIMFGLHVLRATTTSA